MNSIRLLSLEVEFANPEALPIPNKVMFKAIFKTRGLHCSLEKAKYTWSHTRSIFSGRQAENERNLFVLHGLGGDSEVSATMLTERRAAYCLYKCLFPMAGWEEGLTWDQAFRFLKASSLVDKWWESQKGRLGGQGLCTSFHILLHSGRVLPDKVIVRVSQKGPQGSSHPPIILWGQGTDEDMDMTAHHSSQKGQHFQFGEDDWKLAAESCIRYGGLGHKLLSGFGASKGLLLWFSLTETPKCSQGLPQLASRSQGSSLRVGSGRGGRPEPCGHWESESVTTTLLLGGLEFPSRKVFYDKVVGWPWDIGNIFSIPWFRKYLIKNYSEVSATSKWVCTSFITTTSLFTWKMVIHLCVRHGIYSIHI